MINISVQLDDDVKKRMDELVRRHGLDPGVLIREALLDKLEELEDHEVVTERLSRPFKTIPHDQVRKELGLED